MSGRLNNPDRLVRMPELQLQRVMIESESRLKIGFGITGLLVTIVGDTRGDDCRRQVLEGISQWA